MKRAGAWCWRLGLVAAVGCGAAVAPTTRPGWTPGELAAQSRCESGDVTACGALGRSLVQAGRDMRDIERGLVLLEGACGRDDLAACAAAGDWYRVHDQDRDGARATQLLKRACDGRVGDGCRALGELIFEQGDLAGATEMFRGACDLSDAEGCDKWAVFGRKLHGPEAGEVETGFARACALGRMSSCHQLGILHSNRPGTRADGLGLLIRNCGAGYRASCLPAAQAFAPIVGVQPACARASPLAERACAAGMRDGCAIRDACTLKAGPDPGNALARLGEACESGISLACFYWAEAQPQPAQGAAVSAYKSACAGRSAAAKTACVRLAVLALGRAASSAEADAPLSTLRHLCEDGTTAACCALADIYTAGRVTPADPARATQFRNGCPPEAR